MEVKTYRARTMQDALALVRRDLGPQASILHTRELRGGALWKLVPGARQIEVTAAADVMVPSRLPPQLQRAEMPSAAHRAGKAEFNEEVQGQLSELTAMVEDLCRRSQRPAGQELPDELFQLFARLIDAEVHEDLARELIESLRREASAAELFDTALLETHLVRLIQHELPVQGPIRLTPGRRRIAALVGPTGVGKTTTIAKLAANFRLREKRKVGLITVDTYRIAAVEQLRTYADIIDLPMQVVSTPREMRQAIERMADLDLVLLDTAGRSPADECKIQELRSFLTEAAADEVHLVLSSVSSAAALARTASRFTEAGANALILTKLDEAAALGNVLPLLRNCKLPVSYLTDGQNVPDDIAPAEANRLARAVLGLAPAS